MAYFWGALTCSYFVMNKDNARDLSGPEILHPARFDCIAIIKNKSEIP